MRSPELGNEAVLQFLSALPVPALVADEGGVVVAANPLAEATRGDKGWPAELARLDGAREVQLGDAWRLASVAAVHWHGRPARLIIFPEITELKRREADLRNRCEEAEQAVRAKMRFFAAASHDLRQPLQALALFVSALENHVATPQSQRIFASLKVSLRSMEEMFESLLDMSRLDAGVLTPEPRVVPASDLLETLETEFAGQAQQAGLKLRVVYSSLSVYSDPAMLTRILRNFLSNALRYTRAGGILLGCRRRGGFLRFEVWDTGVGIAAEQQQEIFGEFVQGKAAATRKGLGLGLAIVQRLARLLGHRLALRSVEGKGSLFAVEVPLAESAANRPRTDEEDAEAADVGGLVVALVDDDVAILEGVRTLIEQWGGRVVAARTAAETEARLRQLGLAPDLILSDMLLHSKDSGLDSVRRLRQAFGAQVPAFLFTGSTSHHAEAEGLPVLRKPLDPARLRAALAAVKARG